MRSEKTTTGQAAKRVDRYKTWPWAQQMSFFKTFLKFADTESNISSPDIQQNDAIDSQELITNNDESSPAVSNMISQGTSAENLPTAASQTPIRKKVRRSSSSVRSKEETEQSSVDKVVGFLKSRKEEQHDDIDLLFLGYAKTIKKFSKKRQITTKYRVAKIIMEQEMEEMEEMTNASSFSSYPSSSTRVYYPFDTTTRNFVGELSPHSQQTEDSRTSHISATVSPSHPSFDRTKIINLEDTISSPPPQQTEDVHLTDVSITTWYENFGQHTNL